MAPATVHLFRAVTLKWRKNIGWIAIVQGYGEAIGTTPQKALRALADIIDPQPTDKDQPDA